MITAGEARKVTNEMREAEWQRNIKEAELFCEEIGKVIEDAANDGCSEITYIFDVPSKVRQHVPVILKNYGFSVQRSENRERAYIIRW